MRVETPGQKSTAVKVLLYQHQREIESGDMSTQELIELVVKEAGVRRMHAKIYIVENAIKLGLKHHNYSYNHIYRGN